jgi:Lysozyme like domain
VARASASQIAQYAANAGFSGKDLAISVAVAMAESSGNTDAHGDGGWSIGLWQIYRKAHPQYSEAFLLDPQNNARAAKEVHASAGNRWTPWTTYKTGAYLLYMPTAEVAAQRVQPKGGILAAPSQAGTHLPDTTGGPSILDTAKAIGGGVSLAAKAGTWITNPKNITRVIYVFVGALLISGALVMLAAPTLLGQTPVGKTVKTARRIAG